MPVAVNCFVVLIAIEEVAGVSASETSDAMPVVELEVTVRLALLESDPEVALMVAVPVATAEITPVELTVAMPVALEDQVTDDVRFCVEPSL